MPDYDVIVIGGGPAGSACSALVAEDGHRVLLLERDEFPRHHIGESLIPAVVPILRRLGVTDELERRGYLRKKGTTFRWGADTKPWTIGFAENHPRLSYSYQVLRSDFDEILLCRARDGGVDVRTGHEVVDVDVDSPTEARVVYRDARGRTRAARSRFIVDASGRKGVVTTKLQQRRYDPELRNMAIYGYFRGSSRLEPPRENNTLVEGYDEGWFWHIPLHVGVVSVGTVIELDRNHRIPRTELAAALHERIGRTTMVAEMLAEATMVEGPYLLSDWSYVSDAFWGPNHLVVGDAACFVDPLFSTGVHLATQGAVTAAACLNTVLRGERRPEDAFPYYERTYRDEYEDIREIVLLMYGGVRKPVGSVFWGARRISRLPNAVPARRAFVRLISGHARFGVTDSPLDPLDLPPHWTAELSSYRRRLEQRAATIQGFSDSQGRSHPFDRTSLTVDPEISISPTLYVTNDVDDHQAVGLGEGYLVRTPYDPRGHPRLPATIHRLLPLVDGRRAVRDLLRDVAAEQLAQADGGPALDEQSVRKELASLYWHGALEITQGSAENGGGPC